MFPIKGQYVKIYCGHNDENGNPLIERAKVLDDEFQRIQFEDGGIMLTEGKWEEFVTMGGELDTPVAKSDKPDLLSTIIDLISAIECDYGKISSPGELYTRDMKEHPLSNAVIEKLFKVYETGFHLIELK